MFFWTKPSYALGQFAVLVCVVEVIYAECLEWKYDMLFIGTFFDESDCSQSWLERLFAVMSICESWCVICWSKMNFLPFLRSASFFWNQQVIINSIVVLLINPVLLGEWIFFSESDHWTFVGLTVRMSPEYTVPSFVCFFSLVQSVDFENRNDVWWMYLKECEPLSVSV